MLGVRELKFGAGDRVGSAFGDGAASVHQFGGRVVIDSRDGDGESLSDHRIALTIVDGECEGILTGEAWIWRVRDQRRSTCETTMGWSCVDGIAEIINIEGRSYRINDRIRSNEAKAPTGSVEEKENSKRAKAPTGSGDDEQPGESKSTSSADGDK